MNTKLTYWCELNIAMLHYTHPQHEWNEFEDFGQTTTNAVQLHREQESLFKSVYSVVLEIM